MSSDYIRERITELRMKKDISEYQLSLDLGKSKSYIQNISSGKALPSLKGLFDICEYFDMDITEFFSTTRPTDEKSLLTRMNKADLEKLSGILMELKKLDIN